MGAPDNQPPGPRNVLGKVKFVFPSKHDVYMHDTPQKHLFAKPVRAESHGCMRVQNPDQLAGVILRHDQNWSRARTVSALETGYDQHVGLRQKVPVHITYFTLRVNEDGSVTTFRDLYAAMTAVWPPLFFRGRHRSPSWAPHQTPLTPKNLGQPQFSKAAHRLFGTTPRCPRSERVNHSRNCRATINVIALFFAQFANYCCLLATTDNRLTKGVKALRA